MGTHKLTDLKVSKAKSQDKDYKLPDGLGLYLLVTKAGGKIWRYRYRIEGKERTPYRIGRYPEVSLKEARERLLEARKLVDMGIDPNKHREEQKKAHRAKTENTFEAIALEWLRKAARGNEDTKATALGRLKKDIFPFIGSRPICEITAPELLEVLRRVETRGVYETTHRLQGRCKQIFDYAIVTGRAELNPAASLKMALVPKPETKHYSAITEPKRVGELMRMLDSYSGTLVVRCALKLAPLTFVRPGELRKARWKDIHWDRGEWRYEVSKTKTDHIVPLSRQAISILREIQPLTGHGEYVFPSARSPLRPMSDAAINSALARMEIPKEEMTGHGFRAMARTLLDEEMKARIDLIEQQLAHNVRGPLGRAYNRTTFIDERHELMQKWADYLDKLKESN